MPPPWHTSARCNAMVICGWSWVDGFACAVYCSLQRTMSFDCFNRFWFLLDISQIMTVLRAMHHVIAPRKIGLVRFGFVLGFGLGKTVLQAMCHVTAPCKAFRSVYFCVCVWFRKDTNGFGRNQSCKRCATHAGGESLFHPGPALAWEFPCQAGGVWFTQEQR